MSLTHILIDFENVKPTAADLKLIRGAGYRVRLFHGPHQNKFDADIVKVLQPLGIQAEFIQCERAGKNALDFHIAFYLGRLVKESKTVASAARSVATRFARKLENVLQQKPGSGVKIRRLNCELRDLPFTP